MKFEEFKKHILNGEDISKFESWYGKMLDINGTIPSNTIGFHFSVSSEENISKTKELIELFSPITIWCGTQKVLEKIEEMGKTGVLFPWFQEGGFIVVLKTPVKPKTNSNKI